MVHVYSIEMINDDLPDLFLEIFELHSPSIFSITGNVFRVFPVFLSAVFKNDDF